MSGHLRWLDDVLARETASSSARSTSASAPTSPTSAPTAPLPSPPQALRISPARASAEVWSVTDRDSALTTRFDDRGEALVLVVCHEHGLDAAGAQRLFDWMDAVDRAHQLASSVRIASTAASGSSACVIGRPTTTWLAPAAIAAAAVAVRC